MRVKIKKTILFFLIILLSRSAGIAREVYEVIIRGNDKVSESRILEEISLKPGQDYSPSAAGEDLGAIYALNKFDDVSVSLEEVTEESVRVIYTVKEKPLVEDISFKGNRELRARVLRRQLEIEKDGFFDEFLARRGSAAVERYYRGRGYADARVEVFTEESPETGNVKVTYYVEEGHKIEVEKLSILGVLRGDFRRVSRMIDLKEGKVFEQDKLDEGIRDINTYYRNNGYLNVEIKEPVITFDPERKRMYITVVIDEGRQYTLGEVSFTGNLKVSDSRLKESIRVRPGVVFSDERVEEIMADIHELYGTLGHIRLAAEPRFNVDEETGKVDLEFNINEGPEVFIRDIHIEGNHVTRDYVIQREIDVSPGDPFNLEEVRDSQARIFRTGFFSNVMIDMLPAGPPDRTDLVFHVEEQKTGMASLGAGYSSEDRLVGMIRVSQENLFGRGQRLSAMWEFGARKQNYRLDFHEPWLFNTPTPFGASLYNTVRRRYFRGETISGSYDERRSGGSLMLGRHFTREFTAQARYSLEQVRQYNIDASIEDFVLEDAETTSSITPNVTYDARDIPFDPSKGYYLRLSNQIAGGILGGDQSFMKTRFNAAYFQPVVWRLVLALNLRLGSAFAYGSTEDVPLYERFLVGGAESVRGYEYYGDIGPAGGGNYKLVSNIELKFPLISEEGRTVIQGAFFYDVGGSWLNRSDITLAAGTEKHRLKRGYGVGIRFKMPGFPIRLDWGYGLDKRPRGAQWYFTLGDIFY